MLFFAILAIATAGAALVVRQRRAAARWGFGIALAVAGGTHLANPVPFEQHLPDWVPAAGALVAVTGLLEIALGVALVAHGRRRAAVGLLTAAYLAAVFPANVYVALAGVEVDGQPGGIYPWIRLPFQALFIAWVLWSTREAPTANDPRLPTVTSRPGAPAPVGRR